ncbi:unnamed protein product [Ceratitis capitata]|uniref:(Mediterranean fruit fly) hypothetical protein n=1 Tax=Ceratitis capitata TaxID=7213 RepID=A0A811UGB5_CERCA|nr:unnamed protein product [Ceratitis capitata]
MHIIARVNANAEGQRIDVHTISRNTSAADGAHFRAPAEQRQSQGSTIMPYESFGLTIVTKIHYENSCEYSLINLSNLLGGVIPNLNALEFSCNLARCVSSSEV